jgi:hypothetical protein
MELKALEKASVKEQYRDIFKSYLKLAKDGRLKDVMIPVVSPQNLENVETLKDLETCHALEIVDRETGKRELLLKTPFITKFGEYVAREYGLPKMGFWRMAEILKLKRTSREIGGKKVNDLFTPVDIEL